jgi:nucleoside-diphosphate-sugar epimerase
MINMQFRNDQSNLDSDSMNRRDLYAIAGITGKVGGVLARTLLAANQPVRAVVRSEVSFRHPEWPFGFDIDAPMGTKARMAFLDRAAADKTRPETPLPTQPIR